MAEDLTKRQKTHVVICDHHTMDEVEHAEKFTKLTEEQMLRSIEISRRVAWRQLSTRMGFMKRCNTVSGAKSNDLDNVLNAALEAGLEETPTLGDYKILGAILNPLFQCEERMIDAGLCMQDQFSNGEVDLLERMTRYYERKTSHVEILDNDGSPVKTNKYSKLQAGPVDTSSSPQQQAKDQFALYQRYNDVAYLPEMKALKVLGSIDDVGDPKEPVYEIGPVKSRGKNLDKRQKNHADYMDEKGGYDMILLVI